MTKKKFVNPYNFAPLNATVPRRPLEETPGWAVWGVDNFTGWLEIEITTLTRLLLPSQRREDCEEMPVLVTKKNKQTGKKEKKEEKHIIFNQFLEDPVSGKKMIPGTALKGPVRAVLEALSDSCLSMWEGKYEYVIRNKRKVPKVNYSDKLADPVKPDSCRLQNPEGGPISTPNEGLCHCCQLFGKTGEASVNTEENERSNALQGRVVFGDALLIDEDYKKISADFITLKELSSPKPRHQAFSLRDNTIRGRKFYVHREDNRANYEELPDHKLPEDKRCERKTDRNRSFRESILSGSRFTGRVYFTNLTSEEMGLLLWGLELDELKATVTYGELSPIPDGLLAHKIGMGKPLGLGSVKVRVSAMGLINQVSRYDNLVWPRPGEATVAQLWRDADLRREVVNYKKGWAVEPFKGKDQLKRLLTFDQFQGKLVTYPSYSWFRDENCKKIPLPEDGELEEPCSAPGAAPGKPAAPQAPRSGPEEDRA